VSLFVGWLFMFVAISAELKVGVHPDPDLAGYPVNLVDPARSK